MDVQRYSLLSHRRRLPLEQEDRLKEQLRELFSSQKLAVLATHYRGQPHATLVAFAVTQDLKRIVFATNRETRKYANINEDPRVSMLVNNSTNDASDFRNALAVTVTGSVRQVGEQQEEEHKTLYLSKHPYLEDFINSPTCAMIVVQVDVYYLVSRFQDVMTLKVKE